VEACWILAGRNDAALPGFFNSRLSDFVGRGEVITGAYGERLRGGGFDQLDLAAQALLENRDTRQVVLQLYSGPRDFPTTSGKPRHQDVPCNVTSLLKIRHGKLEWTQIVRSNDLMLGVPYNFVQFTILQEVLAGWIGVELGSYFQLSDSLHVYTRHDTLLTQSLAKNRNVQRDGVKISSEPSYSWAMPRSEFSALFPELMRRLDVISSPRSKIGDNTITLNDLPAPFLDVVYVASAEAARRRKDAILAAELGSRIVDQGLRDLWHSWATDRANLVPFPSIEQAKMRGFD
jgi:thymidylate synthase